MTRVGAFTYSGAGGIMADMPAPAIVLRPPADLIPYENNPRENKRAIDAVASSIAEFGFQQPIVVDAEDVIIIGHTRREASLQLGLDEVPVIVANLTPEQARALRLADNRTGELAQWDFALLHEELDALTSTEIDLHALGFGPYLVDETTPADEFPEVTIDGLTTDHTCPKCGYEF